MHRLLASESSSVPRPSPGVQGDGLILDSVDPLRRLIDIASVEEVWVDWQLCPPADSESAAAPSVLP